MFCWGLSKHGQAGKGDKSDKVILPNEIKFNNIKFGNIVDISAGGLFSAAITDKNYLLSFGCGKYGRLGCGDENDKYEVQASKINCDGKLIKIACGLWHACVFTDTGAFYIWGHHKPCGSINKENILKPTLIVELSNVIGVTCGNNFTLAWTTDGSAFSWGNGQYGVLGHGDLSYVQKPKLIASLNQVKISNMGAGFSHCAAVTDDGQLYTWGKNQFGALGLGTSTNEAYVLPQLIPNNYNTKQVSCNIGENHGHTLLCTHDGLVYASGDGYKGKLGLGNQDSYSSFERVPVESFSGELIEYVSSGGIHSSAVSKDGHVYTWGCGSDGRLGHPEAEGHRYLFRCDVPRIVQYLKDKQAVKVSASYYHTIAYLEG